MARSWIIAALLLAAACAPTRDPIAVDRTMPSGTFGFPYVDPAVPHAPTSFSGSIGDASGAPRFVYPLDGAMHPINIGQITLQWSRGAPTSKVFRITLLRDADQTRYDFYVPCAVDACQFSPPPDAWLTLAFQNRDGGLTTTVEGTDGAGGPIYRSPSITVRFSPDWVTGGLYYWTGGTAGGTTYRLPFGAAQATPFIVPNSGTNPYSCGGCHSVSRDGTVISFSAAPDGNTSMGVLIASPTDDPTRPMVPPNADGSGIPSRFTALNANGSRVLLTTFGQIAVFDATSGATTDVGDPNALLPRGKLVTHPEWSPSGTRVAFTMYTGIIYDAAGTAIRTIADTRPSDGEIVTMRFDPATGRLGDLKVIVPMSPADKLFHFYPSWSPDEKWLAFASGPLGVTAYAAPDARLRLAAADVENQVCPGPTCYELANASQGSDLSSTWPKLSTIALVRDSVLFVTFSSKMNYGSVLLNTGPGGANRAQLWMSAIDLRGLVPGGDPSLPPVWLPFQDVTQANHLPFWTAIVACTDNGISYARCGDQELCVNGMCVPTVP